MFSESVITNAISSFSLKIMENKILIIFVSQNLNRTWFKIQKIAEWAETQTKIVFRTSQSVGTWFEEEEEN